MRDAAHTCAAQENFTDLPRPNPPDQTFVQSDFGLPELSLAGLAGSGAAQDFFKKFYRKINRA
ncbi:MAG: hypothetical protein Q8L26_00205 [Candidatus Omnitrophota bacterium]|nr:hypothetical protein [Candidatus Omnitrophota bacterium]